MTVKNHLRDQFEYRERILLRKPTFFDDFPISPFSTEENVLPPIHWAQPQGRQGVRVFWTYVPQRGVLALQESNVSFITLTVRESSYGYGLKARFVVGSDTPEPPRRVHWKEEKPLAEIRADLFEWHDIFSSNLVWVP